MIFLEAALSPQNIDERGRIHVQSDDHNVVLKKRKFEELGDRDPDCDHEEEEEEEDAVTFLKSSSKVVQNTIELHLETPLPLDWQQYLHTQSGKKHFYNTRTRRRTRMDPRSIPELIALPSSCLNLDLELNLKYSSEQVGQDTRKKPRGDLTLARSDSSWLTFDHQHHNDTDQDDDHEMLATVCMNCHMLVMLCKSSPACPSCKFMHPPDRTPLNLFNSR